MAISGYLEKCISQWWQAEHITGISCAWCCVCLCMKVRKRNKDKRKNWQEEWWQTRQNYRIQGCIFMRCISKVAFFWGTVKSLLCLHLFWWLIVHHRKPKVREVSLAILHYTAILVSRFTAFLVLCRPPVWSWTSVNAWSATRSVLLWILLAEHVNHTELCKHLL